MKSTHCKFLILFLTITFIGLFAFSCKVGDDTAPAAIEDLTYESETRLFRWISPGDDGDSGRATIYDLRFFEDIEIADILGVPNLNGVTLEQIRQVFVDNFDIATQILNEPDPEEAGTPQDFLLDRLDITGTKTFYFTLNTRDEIGNNAGPSNVVEVTTQLTSIVFNGANSGCFGESVGAGDFNDDDINDIVISDPCLQRVYVFFGSNDLATLDSDSDGVFDLDGIDTPDLTIIGNSGEGFGMAVTGMFSISGDDADEIVIGSPDFDGGRGKFVVIEGDSDDLPTVIDLTGTDEARFTIVGENFGDNLGFSLANGRGIEGSFVRDLIVGAPGYSASKGRVYIFNAGDFEDETTVSDAKATMDGEAPGNMFGFFVATLGDVNEDDFLEFGVGSPVVGKVYIFYGTSGIESIDLGLDLSEVTVIAGSAADGFGAIFSGNGDIDGNIEQDPFFPVDGPHDVVVGTPGENMETGAVLLYSGSDINDSRGTGISPVVRAQYNGLVPGDNFGASVSAVGDLNPDLDKIERDEGFILGLLATNADFVVGAPGTTNGTSYVFFGANDIPAVVSAADADITIDGLQVDSEFGKLIQALGDITGDGISDFSISADNMVEVEF